jgi:enolase
LTRITSIKGRIIHDSRGNKTIEVDIISDDQFLGRTCAPAGASVGKNEVISFPEGKPEESLRILNENSKKFLELDPNDLKIIDDTIKSIDKTSNFSKVGGALAYAVTIAAMESAAKSLGKPLFELISEQNNYRFPIPLGNLLGGGAHAGPGTPDIQEILISATGAKTIRDAIETNFIVHKELRKEIEKTDSSFTNGRGDEGGWAPKCDNEKALELCARTCENLGYTLGKEVSLGVDFASSTQWNEKKQKYVYERAGFENTPEQQIEFTSSIIEKYKLNYAEDAVHEEAFEDMSKLTSKFPNTMITGDDLTVTNEGKLKQAISMGSCNAAILKVNQAGSLFDALEFAKVANDNNIKLITSHRSGESIDSHITHIGIGTNSKLLKIGIVGGERVAKLNELIRLSEHDLIQGVAQI